MAALKSTQSLNVDFTNHTIVGHATLDTQDVTVPAFFERCSNPTVTILAIITLDDIGVYIKRS